MPAPSCSIDFARPFSLPFGVPPTLLSAVELATYLAELGAHAEVLFLDRPGRVEHDPGLPRDRLFRLLALANDANRAVLLPRTTKGYGAPGVADRGEMDKVAVSSPEAAKTAPPLTLPEVAANRFRWDAHARNVAALPVPVFADESLVIDWPLAKATPGAIGQAAAGVVADAASEFLIATTPAARDGELNPELLRSPVVGLVRFERYRHVVQVGISLRVDRPSNAGAVVIQALPNGAAMPPQGSPIFRKHLVVIEHVARQSAIECLSALVLCQLIRGTVIQAQPALTTQWAKSVTWLLSTWLAYLTIARATHRPGSADPLPSVAAERAPFEQGFAAGPGPAKSPTPTSAQTKKLIDRVLTTSVARASLLEYIQSVYAPILCGASWKEVGIELPIDPTARPAGSKRAHRALEALMTTSETWLPCFAGCPVGTPARFYEAAGSPALARRALLPLERITTFDLEALQISEWVDLAFPGVTAPSLPDRFHPPNVAPYDGEPGGRLAAFRVVDAGGGDQALLTGDWLNICTKGTNAKGRFAAPVDFSGFAAANHPLKAAVGWPRFEAASAARARLDDLRDADVQGRAVRVAKASIDWWIAQTNVEIGGLWPVTLPGAGPPETAPTPTNPYGFGATSEVRVAGQLNEPSGFDEYDIEAAVTAREIVSNGATLAKDLEVGLILALLDREGAKSVGGFERTGMPRQFAVGPGMAAWGADDFGDMAVANWLIFPFGLDLLVRGNTANPNGHRLVDNPFDAGFRARFRAMVLGMGQRLMADGILPVGFEPDLGPARMLAALRQRRLRKGPTVDLITRSRSAFSIGVILQQATFQWVHRRLTLATRPRHAPTPNPDDFAWVRVDELVAAAPPSPGSDAGSADRRRYLAYWGLVYLAFNTSPRTWNAWVNAVPDPAIAAGTSVSEWIVYHRNADPAALEPAGLGAPATRGQRGNMLRFVAGLDAYLRMALNLANADLRDPNARGWPAP